MKKRTIIALLCLLATLLSSCGIITINRGGDTTPTDTESPTDTLFEPTDYTEVIPPDRYTEAEEMMSALPERDFDGKAVFFAVAEETGDIFSDGELSAYSLAVLKRNELVNKKYNTTVISQYYTKKDLENKISKANKSGDFFADFAVIGYEDVGSYFSSGYLRNLRSLDGVELDDDCYDQRAMAQLTAGRFSVGAVGYANDHIGAYNCLFINKDMAKASGIEIDYKKIRQGGFTYEYLISMLKSFSGDAEKLALDNEDGLIYASYFTTGQTYLAADDGSYKIDCNTDAANAVIASMKELIPFTKEKITFEAADDEGETEKITLKGDDIFREGRSLMLFSTLDAMKALQNCGFSWEVLPMPKNSEEDELYSTSLGADAPITVALRSAENFDTSGYALHALNVASYGHLRQEYYAYAQRELISGINTLDMIDLVCQNPIYDHASMFGSAYKNLRGGTYSPYLSAVTGKKTFKTYLANGKSALNRYLSSIKNN